MSTFVTPDVTPTDGKDSGMGHSRQHQEHSVPGRGRAINSSPVVLESLESLPGREGAGAGTCVHCQGWWPRWPLPGAPEPKGRSTAVPELGPRVLESDVERVV